MLESGNVIKGTFVVSGNYSLVDKLSFFSARFLMILRKFFVALPPVHTTPCNLHNQQLLHLPVLAPSYQAQTGETVEMPEDSGFTGTWQDGIPQFNNTIWTLNTRNPESNGQTYQYSSWPNVIHRNVNEIEKRWREFCCQWKHHFSICCMIYRIIL